MTVTKEKWIATHATAKAINGTAQRLPVMKILIAQVKKNWKIQLNGIFNWIVLENRCLEGEIKRKDCNICICRKEKWNCTYGLCPKNEKECARNERLTCGSACLDICDNPIEGVACAAVCKPTCDCLKGYKRNSFGFCQRHIDCPKRK